MFGYGAGLIGGVAVVLDDGLLIETILGWAMIVFMILGLVLELRGYYDRRPRVILDEGGLLLRHVALEPIPWREIEAVVPDPKSLGQHLWIRLCEPSPWLARRRVRERLQAQRARKHGLGDLLISVLDLDCDALTLSARIEQWIAYRDTPVGEGDTPPMYACA